MVSLSGKGKRAKASAKMEKRTICIVDIENASVGIALAQVSRAEAPRLFAETRTSFPLPRTLGAAQLLAETKRHLRSALEHISTVAARIRTATKAPHLGAVSEVAVFIAPPWSQMTLGKNASEWKFEESLISVLQNEIASFFGDISVSFHPFGGTAALTTGALFPEQEGFLLCAISGETTELATVEHGNLSAWGTLPTGHRDAIRTLTSHGGITHAEAHSALRLSRHQDAPAFEFLHEPLSVAGAHFTSQFKDAAEELMRGRPLSGILVLAREPYGEWFARAISQDVSLVDLFPHGGAVRALQKSHLSPHVASHGSRPDLHLMLEVLFINGI